MLALKILPDLVFGKHMTGAWEYDGLTAFMTYPSADSFGSRWC